jgi:hypothetical protein
MILLSGEDRGAALFNELLVANQALPGCGEPGDIHDEL